MTAKYHLTWPTHNRKTSLLKSLEVLKSLDPESYSVTISHTGDQLLSNLGDSIQIFEGEKRNKWIDNLIVSAKKENISSDTINFALRPVTPSDVKIITTGANRNFLLLRMVGKKFLSFDDDINFAPLRIKQDSPSIRSNQFNPFNLFFAKDDSEIKKVIGLSTEISTQELFDSHLALLQENNAISMSGIYGDSAMRSPRMVFGLDENSLCDLLSKNGDFHNSITSRLILRYSEDSQSLKMSPFLPPCSGYANDDYLPPFSPIGRNEDGAYVFTLAGTQKKNIGISPYTVHHVPSEVRSYEGTFAEYGGGLNDLLCLFWVKFLSSGRDKNEEQASLFFKTLASSDENQFKNYIHALIKESFQGKIQRLENKIESISKKNLYQGEQWINLAKEELDNYKAVLQDDSNIIPLELRALSSHDSYEFLKYYISSYAELLRSWSLLRKLALQTL